jgi:DNA transformation protein and related proteins
MRALSYGAGSTVLWRSSIVAVARKAKPARPARKLRSLNVSDGFKAFVLDQLEEVGDVVPKSMFGGVGLYHRGLFFGIIARDTLYLKVDADTVADYESARMQPFNPYPGRTGTTRYYAVPLDVLESALDLAAWARKAIAAASATRESPGKRPA